jgi:pyridoxamine 5'-phosphate oxidase
VIVEDFRKLRREYERDGLDESQADPDPFDMFREWLSEAIAAGLYEPNAMVLATVGLDGAPTSRIVLLKGLDERGFVFFTNYQSGKGYDLHAEPRCSVVFPWQEMERQVRVEGTAERLTDGENETYFESRPRQAQLGAWASEQSKVVASRDVLDAEYAEVEARFDGKAVPRPPHWGGFRIVPTAYEFWQGRVGRLHDRLRYSRPSDSWTLERLAP